MKKIIAVLAVMGVASMLVVGFTRQSRPRIGTYDSRAIAIAYGNSSEAREFIVGLQSEMAKARAAGNDALAREIEQKAKAHQILGHLQAFSIGSVAEILEKHKSEVEQIAKEARVEAMVSTYELAYLGGGIETVDLTAPLTRIFKPNGQVMRWIEEVPQHKPLPMLDVLQIPAEH